MEHAGDVSFYSRPVISLIPPRKSQYCQRRLSQNHAARQISHVEFLWVPAPRGAPGSCILVPEGPQCPNEHVNHVAAKCRGPLNGALRGPHTWREPGPERPGRADVRQGTANGRGAEPGGEGKRGGPWPAVTGSSHPARVRGLGAGTFPGLYGALGRGEGEAGDRGTGGKAGRLRLRSSTLG